MPPPHCIMRQRLYSTVLSSVAVSPNQTLVLGPSIPLRTSCLPPTLYHEAEIILCIPFNLLPSTDQVDFFWLLVMSSGFSRIRTRHHPNISPDSSSDTQPSNSCSELADIWASHLVALQPATTTASQQIRHTRAQGPISLDCLHTAQRILVLFKYIKQRWNPSSKHQPPLPSADRPLL